MVHIGWPASTIDRFRVHPVDQKLLVRATEFSLVSGAWHVALVPGLPFGSRRNG